MVNDGKMSMGPTFYQLFHYPLIKCERNIKHIAVVLPPLWMILYCHVSFQHLHRTCMFLASTICKQGQQATAHM